MVLLSDDVDLVQELDGDGGDDLARAGSGDHQPARGVASQHRARARRPRCSSPRALAPSTDRRRGAERLSAPSASRGTIAGPCPATPDAASSPRRADDETPSRWPLVLGFVAYLAVGVAMFWDVLTLSVTRATTCACSDTSLFAWFFEWPLVALRTATTPSTPRRCSTPRGINLLSNTSVTAVVASCCSP